MTKASSARPRGDAVEICAECGQRHLTAYGYQACAGHVVNDRESYVPGQDRKKLDQPRPCRKDPVPGVPKCRYHGAAPKHAQEAGKRVETERKAAALMQTYGRPVETTATEALLEEVKWTAGHVAWLRERVAELEQDALVWGRTKETDGSHVVGTGPKATLEQATDETREAKPNAFLELYYRERQHLVRVCAEAIKAGIEERRVRLAEGQGQLLADVIRKILGELKLTAEQLALVGEVVPRHLRLVAG